MTEPFFSASGAYVTTTAVPSGDRGRPLIVTVMVPDDPEPILIEATNPLETGCLHRLVTRARRSASSRSGPKDDRGHLTEAACLELHQHLEALVRELHREAKRLRRRAG